MKSHFITYCLSFVADFPRSHYYINYGHCVPAPACAPAPAPTPALAPAPLHDTAPPPAPGPALAPALAPVPPPVPTPVRSAQTWGGWEAPSKIVQFLTDVKIIFI